MNSFLSFIQYEFKDGYRRNSYTNFILFSASVHHHQQFTRDYQSMIVEKVSEEESWEVSS